MRNEYGLDASYFSENLSRILAGVDRHTPAEMARALTRLALLASAADARTVIDREVAPEPATVAVDAGALEELREAVGYLDKQPVYLLSISRARAEVLVMEAARRLLAERA